MEHLFFYGWHTLGSVINTVKVEAIFRQWLKKVVWIAQDCIEQMRNHLTHSVIQLWLHLLLYLSSSLQARTAIILFFSFLFLNNWGMIVWEDRNIHSCVSTWSQVTFSKQVKAGQSCLLFMSVIALPLSSQCLPLVTGTLKSKIFVQFAVTWGLVSSFYMTHSP